MKDLHITELFKQFARGQQGQLRGRHEAKQSQVNRSLDQLLSRYTSESDASSIRRALLDPYFPLGILERTIFANVEGMRFFINKYRSDMDPLLAEELLNRSEAFLRIRQDIHRFFDPARITCIPLDGKKHQLPIAEWCTLCGVCCQIGGVPPEHSANLNYPDYWYSYLAGEALDNQQSCPFLFQYFGETVFFCAIHHIKPLTCRRFDETDCRRRLSEGDLHQHPSSNP